MLIKFQAKSSMYPVIPHEISTSYTEAAATLAYKITQHLEAQENEFKKQI